ncbi:MAG: Holliday junction DNA helicase RuvB C-terminal domain-containing protein, partial [Acidaminococcaceae bacterium]|nr:Holliday junction DNA helicase RuvB C-terminal domain-containing protein [Acidaminococcaceae bacterium]
LEYYRMEDLRTIVLRAAELLKVVIDTEAAAEIAGRSRGTPRIANRLLKRVRDFAQVAGATRVTAQVARESLQSLDVDSMGLDRNDRKLLKTVVQTFGGGPVGVDTLAAAISEETATLEDVYEPFLMQLGLLQRTPKGRKATQAAYEYLGIAYPREKK